MEWLVARKEWERSLYIDRVIPVYFLLSKKDQGRSWTRDTHE
jgi:hypothetical protein